MKRLYKLLVACFSASLLAACGGSVAAVGPAASQPASVARAQSLLATSSCLSSTCIYVVSYDSRSYSLHNKVTYYAGNATGDVAPLGDITGGKTQIEEPRGVAVDSNHLVYVANNTFGSNGSVVVYAAGATGNVKPVQMFSNGDLFEPTGVAVDGSSNIYVANEGGGPSGSGEVLVYAAGANGDPTPIQAIGGSSTGLDSPYGIAVDSEENIYVANDPLGNVDGSVTVYAAGANGNVAPIQTISGSNTGLGDPFGIAADGSKNVYVTNAQFVNVTVYAAGANGNVAPIRTIQGSKTKLSRPYAIALDARGNIYVANTNSAESAAFVTVYAAGANGNVKPIQTIKGSVTKLGGDSIARGIAVR